MGAKSSKKKAERSKEDSSGYVSSQFTLFNRKERFLFEEPFCDVGDLERSTASDRAANSHGLPTDVLGLIASHLSLYDVGRVAQTCKTWRRMTLQPSVWLHFAKVMNVVVSNRGNVPVRTLVLQSSLPTMDVFIPFPERFGIDGEVFTEKEVKIAIMSGPCSEGCGKTCLVKRLIGEAFSDENDPTIEDDYLYHLRDGEKSQVLSIVDTCGQEEYSAMRQQQMRYSHVVLICSKFDRKGAMDGVQQMFDHLCRIKDVDEPVVVLVRCAFDLGLPFVEKDLALEWVKKHKSCLVNTSAKNFVNVELAFKLAAGGALYCGRRNNRRATRGD
jgi:small GTP-binding protein